MIETYISGKAWEAEPWGSDPGYRCDAPDIAEVLATAERLRCGKGYRVRVRGSTDALEHLAHWYECDGRAWIIGCDEPYMRAEGRACIEAARLIRKAIEESHAET